MFTGIITAQGEVRTIATLATARTCASPSPRRPTSWRPRAAPPSRVNRLLRLLPHRHGTRPDWFAVDVSGESVSRTTLGGWAPGTRINLERALRLGDELGGHMVSGPRGRPGRDHRDRAEQGSLRIGVRVPAPLHRYIAAKARWRSTAFR